MRSNIVFSGCAEHNAWRAIALHKSKGSAATGASADYSDALPALTNRIAVAGDAGSGIAR
jgi:hypothetical protein